MTITPPPFTPSKLAAGLLAAASVLLACPAQAQGSAQLVDLINAYRASPRTCDGRRTAPLAPLAMDPALGRVAVTTGTLLEHAIEQAGYKVARAEAISVTGPPDARAAMAAIETPYCSTLLNPTFSEIGASRRGDSWQIVLAEPAPPPASNFLPDSETAGKAILDAVNDARAKARSCGTQRFPAARQVTWNGTLGDAALSHSRDMAAHRYFSHKGRDGQGAAERAVRAGYRWLRIGENIAAGQNSPAEVVAGWLSSPGHCANIMQGGFTEMGAAYAINQSRTGERIYWTQVFAAPR
ncbi:CAP domain-containing protein [Massilia soli]|uniref:CAP domain-containing protein n=1 Tax=Massilia soli TaxID=2792854 RepID=A0ABS7SHW9_9BURK|nr:CAP domain-containing protein [Massilia soli]MBZ2205709.1 CAP domain-containing protein [Massilia soli]